MIATFRQAVFDVISDAELVPVHGYVPDDVSEVPCAIVGRVDLGESDQPAVFDMTLDVWLIGRPVDAGDADLELDLAADSLLEVFGGSRGVRSGTVSCAVSTVTGRTVDIANTSYPAYVLTVITSAASC